MSVRTAIGTFVLWVVAVPLMLLVVALVVAQENDEVAANATTTGTIVDHNETGPDYVCDVAYRVDGRRYEAQDDCTHDENPVGSEVTVNYVADKPAAGFLHGDKTWWDKGRTAAQAAAVLTGILGLTIGVPWLVGRLRERRT